MNFIYQSWAIVVRVRERPLQAIKMRVLSIFLNDEVRTMSKITRRQVINIAIALAGTTVIARFSHAQDIIASDDATALAMGYVADHTTVDTAKWTKKASPGGENQKCTSCTIYQRIDDDYGLCPIFIGKRVHANGWCNGWVA